MKIQTLQEPLCTFCTFSRSNRHPAGLIALLGLPMRWAPRWADVATVMHLWMNPALRHKPPARPTWKCTHPIDKQGGEGAGGAGGEWVAMADGWIDRQRGRRRPRFSGWQVVFQGVKCRWLMGDVRLPDPSAPSRRPLCLHVAGWRGGGATAFYALMRKITSGFTCRVCVSSPGWWWGRAGGALLRAEHAPLPPLPPPAADEVAHVVVFILRRAPLLPTS